MLPPGVVRAAGRLDRGGQLLQGLVGADHRVVRGAVVVLHLFQGDDVRGREVIDDTGRQGGVLARRVGRCEVFHVVGGDRQFLGRLRRGAGRCQVLVRRGAEGGGGDRVAAVGGPVDRADRGATED